MNIAVCAVLLAPAAVLLVLVLVVAVRPSVGPALSDVLRAAAEPLRAIAYTRRSAGGRSEIDEHTRSDGRLVNEPRDARNL